MASKKDDEAPVETAEEPDTARKTVANILLVDIVLRTGLRLGRRQIEKALLRRNFTRRQARQIISGRPLTKSILSMAAARIASRSVPGALLVGGGIVAKIIIDARKSAKQADSQDEDKRTPTELAD